MISLLKFVVNAQFIVGAIVGGLACLVYFSYTKSKLNWLRRK